MVNKKGGGRKLVDGFQVQLEQTGCCAEYKNNVATVYLSNGYEKRGEFVRSEKEIRLSSRKKEEVNNRGKDTVNSPKIGWKNNKVVR